MTTRDTRDPGRAKGGLMFAALLLFAVTAQIALGQTSPERAPAPRGEENLSDRLDRSDGVITPPGVAAPIPRVEPPNPGTSPMPVIPPPDRPPVERPGERRT